jgi:hypothetical protein
VETTAPPQVRDALTKANALTASGEGMMVVQRPV